MPRTDIHRPAEIVPADYDFVAYDYLVNLGAWQYLVNQRRLKAEHMARTGGRYSDHEHGGSCYVCGAHAIYTATFWHRRTNVYIHTGLECAEKMGHGDGENFRRRVHEERERQRGIQKAKETLFAKYDAATANTLWGLYNAPTIEDKYEERTICSMVGNLVRYGSISDRAAAFLGTLPAKIAARATVAAERVAAQAAALPVPTGKVLVRGTVLSLKTADTAFGPVCKMLVQHADGWKVYGSKPSALDIERGMQVEFSATIERSREDEKFGFYKRPTKAKILQAGA